MAEPSSETTISIIGRPRLVSVLGPITMTGTSAPLKTCSASGESENRLRSPVLPLSAMQIIGFDR